MQQQAFSSAAMPTYYQTIQNLGQMGDFYHPGSLVGGSGGGGSAPPGVDPMDLLTPIMMGQTTLPEEALLEGIRPIVPMLLRDTSLPLPGKQTQIKVRGL